MRQLTIALPDDVSDDLERRFGPEIISGFVEQMVRPHVVPDADREADYRAMTADVGREREALEWIEAAPRFGPVTRGIGGPGCR